MVTKALAVLAVVAMLGYGAALPVTAKPGAARQVTIEYQGPNTLANDDAWISHTGPMASPRAGERFVEVDLTDASGRSVLAEIHQGSKELAPAFCGETPGPVKLQGRRPVHVHIYAGAGCGEGSVPTKGTISLTFLKR